MIVSIALAGAFLRGLYGVLSRQPGRAATAAALALVLTGCNLTIVVPEGGRVLSLQGVECEAGESCTLEISTLGFFDSFSATANPGYAFSGWRTANMHLCAGGSAACVLDFRNVPSTPQILSLLASTTEFFLAPTFESTGADGNRYPVDQWRQLANSLNASGNRSDSFLYNRLPNEANCDPGELTNAAKNRFMLSVNLIRRLHYLPLVELDSFWDTQMQETALVQLANNTLTHYPNTGHDCYTSGAAAGAGSSNLSYRSLQSDPAYYPLAWVNDSRNLSALMEAGHRRWVLHPHLAITAYGQTEGYTSMKVFGFGQSFSGELTGDIDYIAMPYREYPYLMVERGFYPTPWSLTMVPGPGESGAYAYFSNASVTVVETATGAPLTVHSVHSDNRGYGIRNFFSWMVDDWEYDTPYTVTISNVSMPDGGTRTIQYPVEIDYAQLQ